MGVGLCASWMCATVHVCHRFVNVCQGCVYVGHGCVIVYRPIGTHVIIDESS